MNIAHHQPIRRTAAKGFTLTELMTVIAVICVLMGVLVMALSSTHDASLATVCLSNQRQLAKGDVSFAVDNKGRLWHPRTTSDSAPDFSDEGKSRIWVDDSAPGNATDETLRESNSFEYLGNIDVYKSPLDATTRLRSYSLNALVGVNKGADDHQEYSTNWGSPNISPNYVPCPTLARVAQPSRTLCTIGEEDADTYEDGTVMDNRHGWLVHPGSPTSFTPIWIDEPPLDWDPGKVHLSYMDGSTFTYQLSDYKNLREALDSHNQSIASVDYEFFRMIMLPGRLRQ